MKTTKTGIFTKIISCLLCTAITLQVGLALTMEKVNAAGSFSEAEGFISVSDGSSGKIITVNSQDEEEGVILSIKDQDNPEGNETGYRVVLYVDSLLEDDPNPLEETIDKIEKINILGSSMLTVYSKKIETEIYIENENGSVNTSQGSTLKITRLSGFGIINNQGTLQFSDYDSDDYSTEECAIHIANSGTIIADNIDISTTYAVINGDETPTVSQGENSIYQATTSFTKGEDDMLGKVVANPDTKIISAGGTFNLQVGDIEKEITGAVNTTADKLVFKDPNPILGDVPDVYYGQDFDSIFLDYVSVDEGYDGEVYFEYADSMQNILENKPVAPSEYSYNVRAVAPADGTYHEAVSDWEPFKISYLELTDLYPEGTTSFVTVSGYDSYDSSENKYYFGNSLVLTAPEGILIGCPSSEAIEGFSSSVSIPISELVNNDGSINQDFTIEFRRDDDATTSGKSILDIVNNFDNYVFDDKDPEIYAAGDDGNTTNPNNPPGYKEYLALDGSLVDLWFLDIIVSDDNLASVVINDDGTEIDYSNSITDGKCLITVQCPGFERKEFSITATDKAGRVSQGQLKMENFYQYGIDFLSISKGNSGKIYTFTPSENYNATFYIHDVSEGVMNSRYESEEEMKEWGLDPDRTGYDYEIVSEKKDGGSGGGWIGWTEENFERLEIDGENLTVVSSAHIETEVSFGDESSELQILEGSTFTFKDLSGGQGTITNSGTIVFSNYDSADYSTEDCAIKIVNNGTLIADNIDISTNYADAISQSENSILQVTASKANTSFTKGDDDILGKVIVNSDTVINSAGGTFTMQVGSVLVKISGVITNITAGQLLSGTENYGLILVDGNNVLLQTTGGRSVKAPYVTFTISKDVNGYKIECDYPDGDLGATQTVSSIDKLTIEGYYCYVYIEADLETELYIDGGTTIIYLEAATVTCSKIEIPTREQVWIYVYNELILTDFILSDYHQDTRFYNSGTIIADNIDASGDISNKLDNGYGNLIAKSSFKFFSGPSSVSVIAENADTIIESARTTYILEYNGASRRIYEHESIGPIEAYKLFDDSSVTLDRINDVKYGEDYDFSDKIQTATGYKGTPVLQYSKDGVNFDLEKPSAAGEYTVRAYAPAHNSYMESFSEVQAFYIYSEGNISVSGNEVVLQTTGNEEGSTGVIFNISKASNGYEIECQDIGGSSIRTVSSIDKLTVKGVNCSVQIKDDLETEIELIGDDFGISIEENAEVTFTGLSAEITTTHSNGMTILVLGELIMPDLVCSDYPLDLQFWNKGTICVDTLDTSRIFNIINESQIIVTSSFTNGAMEIDGTIIAEHSDTKIKSAGGKFTLYLTGASGTFEGEIDSTAGELLLEPIEITIDTDGLPGFDIENPIIAGQDYDFDYAVVTNPEGYEHYAYLEYAKIISDEFSTTQPTDSGFYKVRAVIPSSSENRRAVSPEYIFSIQNIALSDLFPDGKYNVSVSGCYNSYYVPEALVLEAPEGVGICIPVLIDESDFFKPYVFYDDLTLSYETLMENGLLVDGHIDGNLIIAFARLEDVEDAEGLIAVTTAGGTAIKNVIPGIENYVFDSYDSGFDAMAVDSEGGLVEVSVDGEDPITADELRITVSDENLATVTVSIDGTVTDLSDSIEDGACEITLYPAEGKAQDIKITAKDLANRESLVEFTLCPETVEPTLVVTLPDTIYYGDEIKPTISINENYEGDITVSYYDPETDTTSTSAPKNAGTYLLIASAKATDYYAETSTEVEFKILPKAIDAESLSIAIDNIKYGEEPVPSVTGLPNDYLGTITYTYTNSEGAEHASGETFTAGTYKVLATISDTNNYTGTTCEAEFTVSKYEIENVTVTVASIKVGDKPAPSVTGLPEDYTAEPLFTYTDSKGVSHSADDLFTEGTYTVLATILPTDKYKGTSCETTFTVGKNEVTATVSVADIFVGETPNPVVTTVSDGKVTIEYKTADTEYTTTIPTAAGEYTVRATVAESDTYLETTCSSTFTINKNEVTKASVSVADIFVGETPNPVVTTDSDGKAVFEYKISTAPDTTYTSEVPTAAGTYMVRATIPETDTYLGTTCTANFDILKNEVTASLEVADIKVGGTVKPVITINPEDYDGTVSYQYKISTAEDSTYTAVVPTAAGTYMVKATLPATDKYLGTTCTTNFDIVKNEVTASVSVDDILVGGTVKPVVTTDPEDYDGVITFEYKGSTDAAFSKTVPTAAGTYTVRATLPETAKFFGTTCTDTFTISKNAVIATVSVADIFVGETPKPVVTTDPKGYDGVITFEYKESSEADTAYTSAVPTAAGRYTVRATLSSTANFLGTSCEDSFSIVRKEVTASVSVANIYVGQTPSPVVITESDGKDKATFEYKLSSDPDTAFTTTAPTKLGTYTCKATIPETDNYLAITCSCEFVINLNPVGVLELSVPDTYYGLTVSSSYNTDSDGEVSIVYKTAGAPDTTYAAVAPTKVGDYTAMITVSETETYESASTTTNFKISYLEAPATAFVPKGTEGNNGYFTSDVDLTAPAGYTISTTLGSGYSGSVAYTESLGSIFLKRDDGALTAAISISDRPKIDKVAPVISSASGVMYVDSMSISVSDKNLMSLTVNGSPVTVSGGSASVTLKRPEKGSKTFTIVAEDEAGNITTIELTLMEEWLSDRKVPEGQAVSLVAGEIYYFNEGEWIVSIVNSDGTVTECSTVFSCNLPFYVNSSGDYIFTRVT